MEATVPRAARARTGLTWRRLALVVAALALVLVAGTVYALSQYQPLGPGSWGGSTPAPGSAAWEPMLRTHRTLLPFTVANNGRLPIRLLDVARDESLAQGPRVTGLRLLRSPNVYTATRNGTRPFRATTIAPGSELPVVVVVQLGPCVQIERGPVVGTQGLVAVHVRYAVEPFGLENDAWVPLGQPAAFPLRQGCGVAPRPPGTPAPQPAAPGS